MISQQDICIFSLTTMLMFFFLKLLEAFYMDNQTEQQFD